MTATMDSHALPAIGGIRTGLKLISRHCLNLLVHLTFVAAGAAVEEAGSSTVAASMSAIIPISFATASKAYCPEFSIETCAAEPGLCLANGQ